MDGTEEINNMSSIADGANIPSSDMSTKNSGKLLSGLRPRRWADITSDEELSISFLKSRPKNPKLPSDMTSINNSKDSSRWRISNLFSKKESKGSTEVYNSSVIDPSKSRSQFPQGFVSLMSLVSSTTQRKSSIGSTSGAENSEIPLDIVTEASTKQQTIINSVIDENVSVNTKDSNSTIVQNLNKKTDTLIDCPITPITEDTNQTKHTETVTKQFTPSDLLMFRKSVLKANNYLPDSTRLDNKHYERFSSSLSFTSRQLNYENSSVQLPGRSSLWGTKGHTRYDKGSRKNYLTGQSTAVSTINSQCPKLETDNDSSKDKESVSSVIILQHKDYCAPKKTIQFGSFPENQINSSLTNETNLSPCYVYHNSTVPLTMASSFISKESQNESTNSVNKHLISSSVNPSTINEIQQIQNSQKIKEDIPHHCLPLSTTTQHTLTELQHHSTTIHTKTPSATKKHDIPNKKMKHRFIQRQMHHSLTYVSSQSPNLLQQPHAPKVHFEKTQDHSNFKHRGPSKQWIQPPHQISQITTQETFYPEIHHTNVAKKHKKHNMFYNKSNSDLIEQQQQQQLPVKLNVITYRLRQLAIEKTSPEYKQYVHNVPKELREKSHPTTPRADLPISCGMFYTQLHEWRSRIRSLL